MLTFSSFNRLHNTDDITYSHSGTRKSWAFISRIGLPVCKDSILAKSSKFAATFWANCANTEERTSNGALDQVPSLNTAYASDTAFRTSSAEDVCTLYDPGMLINIAM